MQAESRLLAVPQELLLRVFTFVYDPWSLEIELRRDEGIWIYHENAIVRATPSAPNVALLATCKSIYRIAKNVMVDAFTGVVKSRETPTLGVLGHILSAPRWTQIQPHVRQLALPTIPYGLNMSKDFIMLFPALEQVELVENLGLWTALVAEPAGDLDREIEAVSDEYYQTKAQRHLPEVPIEIAFCCNGGKIDLLLHVSFGSQRPDTLLSRFLDITFRVASDCSLQLVNKVHAPIFDTEPTNT